MASPTLNAVDKAQRLRRISDLYTEICWLKSIYPIDQHTGIYLALSGAESSLSGAVYLARDDEEVQS